MRDHRRCARRMKKIRCNHPKHGTCRNSHTPSQKISIGIFIRHSKMRLVYPVVGKHDTSPERYEATDQGKWLIDIGTVNLGVLLHKSN